MTWDLPTQRALTSRGPYPRQRSSLVTSIRISSEAQRHNEFAQGWDTDCSSVYLFWYNHQLVSLWGEIAGKEQQVQSLHYSTPNHFISSNWSKINTATSSRRSSCRIEIKHTYQPRHRVTVRSQRFASFWLTPKAWKVPQRAGLFIDFDKIVGCSDGDWASSIQHRGWMSCRFHGRLQGYRQLASCNFMCCR